MNDEFFEMRHKDNSSNGILCGLCIHNEYKVYLIKNCILQVSSQIKIVCIIC